MITENNFMFIRNGIIKIIKMFAKKKYFLKKLINFFKYYKKFLYYPLMYNFLIMY